MNLWNIYMVHTHTNKERWLGHTDLCDKVLVNLACNSKDVDALKFQLVRHDIFYNGQNQQDSTECLLMLINIIESSYILQPPKYLLLFVNRFRYLNNNITKNRCPIPLDTTVRLGPLKFKLQASIDHHEPSIDSGHYTASINCCKKHSIATITKLRSLELPIKTHLLHILYYINGFTHDFWTRTGGWEFDCSHGARTSYPSHWQQVEEQAPKPVGWTTCFLLMTLVPVQKLCVNIYMYVHSLYEFCYRSYIQRDCHSVLAKLHHVLYGSVRFLVWMPFCVFFGLPIVSCSLIKKTNTRMLVTFGIC